MRRLRSLQPFMCSFLLPILALGLFLSPVLTRPAAAQTKPPNILLILMDDVGPEHLLAYGIGEDETFADTEDLDAWLQTWIRFEQAWATPLCSPTRATIQTGRFGHHTGVGTLAQIDSDWGLDPDTDPYVLAKVLGNNTGEQELELPVAYTTAMFGKYHLGTSPGPGVSCDLPDQTDCVPYQGGEQSPGVTGGFDDYVVHHQDVQQDPDNRYHHYWISTPLVDAQEVNTQVHGINKYLTHATFDWFISWCNANDCRNQSASATPWYVYIAPWAAHAPLHCPPTDVYDELPACDDEDNTSMYYAMIYTLSYEIDRTLRYLTGGDLEDPENTLIILAGDNGSPGAVSEPPFDNQRSKGTVAEGGVRVPLWIGGEDVTVSGEIQVENDHFVQLLDLYPTILEVAGLCDEQGCPPSISIDGRSLTRYFDDLDPDPVREFAYTEWFYPNFNPDPLEPEGPAIGFWAVRNATHKWIKLTTGQAALYNVDEDPYEETNLLPGGLGQTDQDAYNDLQSYWASLGFSSTENLLSFCDLEPVGELCTTDDQCCSQMCLQASPPPAGDLTCQLPEQFQ